MNPSLQSKSVPPRPRPPGRIRAATLGLALVAASAPAVAEVTPLADLNSELTFHTEAADGGQFGLNQWKVDGVNQVFQEAFWYRVGSQTREFRTDGSGPLTHLVTAPGDFNLNPGDDDLLVVYEDSETVLTPETFTIALHYELSGSAPGSGRSRLLTDFSVDNSGDEDLLISLFLYSDLDLSGSQPDDHLAVNGTAALQNDAERQAIQKQLSGPPDAFEAGIFSNLRDRLDDGALTSLSGSGGPLGPDDVDWSYQWNFVIPGNTGVGRRWETAIAPVPEASALLPAGLLVMGLAGYRWRARSRGL